MGQLAQLSARWLDVFLGYSLHDSLDTLLDGGLLPKQHGVTQVGLVLPQTVQTITKVIRIHPVKIEIVIHSVRIEISTVTISRIIAIYCN